jgi:rhomboid protease GluP
VVRPLRVAPITAECLVICAALFVVCTARSFEGVRFGDAQREWGAATTLQVFAIRGDRREPVDPDLNGPFDLWDGEWWRIPINAFHHVNAAHLVMNCLAAWSLGSRLERRWGSFRFALFLLPSVYLPILSEFLAGNVGVGFSGAICAMLGALIALKQFDEDDILPDQTVQFYLAFLVLCVWATMLDVIQIANVAHFVGLGYGWFATWAMCGPFRSANVIRVLFVLSHIGLYSLTWYAVQPMGNGRYHWYMADHQPDPRLKTNRLRFAVRCDPTLAGVWLRLADGELIQGDILASWNTLLKGLSHNPTRRELLEAVRRVWRRIPPGIDRTEAEADLKQVFGDRAGDWLIQIKQTALASPTAATDESDEPIDMEADSRQFPLDQKIDLDWQPDVVKPAVPQPFNPQAPDSAAEGTAL